MSARWLAPIADLQPAGAAGMLHLEYERDAHRDPDSPVRAAI